MTVLPRQLASLKLLTIVGAAAACALLGPVGAAQAAFGTANGKIAFHSDRHLRNQIYTMNADGSQVTRITNDLAGAGNQGSVWSPDGTKIAFVSNRNPQNESAFDIYVIKADGSGQTRLTGLDGDYEGPSWSPDGKKIAFGKRVGIYDSLEIHTMNADGSGQKRITNNSADEFSIAWSPDGRKFAFANQVRNAEDIPVPIEIYTMNIDGSGKKRLTRTSNGTEGNFSPSWSPDSKKIVFQSDRDGKHEIYTMRADGSRQRRLTRNSVRDDYPAWSPDGRKIAFTSSRDQKSDDENKTDIYAMNTHGSHRRRLTHDSAADYAPAWQSLTRPCRVPAVVGMTARRARSRLRKAGCSKVRVRRPKTSSNRARRLRSRGFRPRAVRQSRRARTRIAPDTRISFKLGWRR